jgi:hypothetical protein
MNLQMTAVESTGTREIEEKKFVEGAFFYFLPFHLQKQKEGENRR